MTSITKELREYTETFSDMGQEDYEKVLAIADHIDTELSERYVALPLDMDGVPIRAGDDVEWLNGVEHGRVTGIGVGERDGWIWVLRDGRNVSVAMTTENVRHRRHDTWERIIEDALDGYHDTDFEKLVSRCKALCERTKEDA